MVELLPKMAGKGLQWSLEGAARPSWNSSDLFKQPLGSFGTHGGLHRPNSGSVTRAVSHRDMQLAEKLLLLAAAGGTGLLVYRVR